MLQLNWEFPDYNLSFNFLVITQKLLHRFQKRFQFQLAFKSYSIFVTKICFKVRKICQNFDFCITITDKYCYNFGITEPILIKQRVKPNQMMYLDNKKISWKSEQWFLNWFKTYKRQSECHCPYVWRRVETIDFRLILITSVCVD